MTWPDAVPPSPKFHFQDTTDPIVQPAGVVAHAAQADAENTTLSSSVGAVGDTVKPGWRSSGGTITPVGTSLMSTDRMKVLP